MTEVAKRVWPIAAAAAAGVMVLGYIEAFLVWLGAAFLFPVTLQLAFMSMRRQSLATGEPVLRHVLGVSIMVVTGLLSLPAFVAGGAGMQWLGEVVWGILGSQALILLAGF